ncbi:MAG: DUF1598 domain-containing protein [Planctomycetales bacterium]|nr:DUF1598 domain-containing protein [Planctomycetales bacterium]
MLRSRFLLGQLLLLAALTVALATPALRGQQSGQSPNSPGSTTATSDGGAAQADFDSLIDLIQSTVAPDSWADNGTGEGEIAPFDINGVYADPTGTLRYEILAESATTPLRKLPRIPSTPEGSDRARQGSSLRFVSLNKLESAIARRQQQHLPLPPEMLTLAGLQRLQYVMVYPETADLVIAGPAGDWQVGPDGRIVSTETGYPVLRLDDLLMLWRRRHTYPEAAFGCSISPRQAGLAKTQAYVQASNLKPIDAGQRSAWIDGLRHCLGKQDVEFFGMAADSHVARVLLVADYHMKLIGMGLAEPVDGVVSYLDTVELTADGAPPPMAVLRWWFSMKYDPVTTDQDRTLFQLLGPGVEVLSENELLAAHGRRVATGRSEALNRQFASTFTSEYPQICRRYPLYAELRNVFDLAMALAIVQQEGLTERVGWLPTLFADANRLALPSERVPVEVDTVVNHRVISSKHIVAGISGGVWLDPDKALEVRVSKTSEESAGVRRKMQSTVEQSAQSWWWD